MNKKNQNYIGNDIIPPNVFSNSKEVKNNSKIDKTWYYDDKGSNKGPLSESEIRNLIVTGKIDNNTLISNDNTKSWKWVKDIFDIERLQSVQIPKYMNKQYYFIKDGSEDGPIPYDILKSKIDANELNRETLISYDNRVSWIKFYDLSEQKFEDDDVVVDSVSKESKLWYYNDKGVKNGPFTESEMIEKINSGTIKRGELVFKDGDSNWANIENSALRTHIHTPPPLVGNAVNNGSIWWVAFAPLISLAITLFIMNYSAEQYYRTGNIDWEQLYKFLSDWNIIIYVIVNLIFVSIDKNKLQSAGHDTSIFGAIFLIPLYIWKRNKMLQKTQASFVFWLLFTLIDFIISGIISQIKI